MKRVDERLTCFARSLRNAGTKPERILWRLLSRYRPKFTRQFVIEPYIVDLACREAKIAVELDGGQHGSAIAYDTRRTRFLEEQGWTVIRLWNNDALTDPAAAADHILAACATRLGSTHPQPLPSREGRTRVPRSRKTSPTCKGGVGGGS